MSDRKISSIRQVAGDLVAVGRSWAIEVESPEYSVSDADVLDALVQRNYSKRFIYYEEHPDAALYNMWKRTLRTLDAQIRALAIQATANYDPLERRELERDNLRQKGYESWLELQYDDL